MTETEIRIGQTMPYSGPISAYGATGRAQAAYFRMVNDAGGINGRKIVLLSRDDGNNPARTVEQVRKLVEEDDVLLLFSSVGTAGNAAARKYANSRKVPQLFVAGGDRAWGDYQGFPWTMGWMPSFRSEGRLYARHRLRERPTAKVGILHSNDDYGKEYLLGFREALGERAPAIIVGTQSFEWSDATVGSQLVALKATGADTIFTATAGRHAAQAIQKIWSLGWHPFHYTAISATSPRGILAPAGLEKAVGMVSAYYALDPGIKGFANTRAGKDYLEWAAKYYDGDPYEGIAAYGYQVAQALEYVLRACGEDLSRANVMKTATSLRNLELPMLFPGVKVNTSRTDYLPIEQFVMIRFDGKEWVPFTGVLAAE